MGIAIIGKHDAVANKYLVLDRHSGTDERVAGDLATRPDMGTGLDLDECTDPRLITYQATVQVREAVDEYVPPQLDGR